MTSLIISIGSRHIVVAIAAAAVFFTAFLTPGDAILATTIAAPIPKQTFTIGIYPPTFNFFDSKDEWETLSDLPPIVSRCFCLLFYDFLDLFEKLFRFDFCEF